MIKYYKYFQEIFFLLDNSKLKIFILFILTVAISLFDILGLSLIAPYISLILNQSDLKFQFIDLSKFDQKNLILILSLLIVVIYIVKTFLSIFINYYLFNASFQTGARIRKNLFNSYLNLHFEKFTLRNSSEYIYAVEGLVGQFSNSILPGFLKFISDCLIFVLIIVFLLFVNWPIIIGLSLILIILILFYDIFFKKPLKKSGELANKNLALLIKTINESMEGFKEIKVFAKENFFLKKIKNFSIQYANKARYGAIVANSPKYILELILVLFIVLALSFAINLEVNVNNLLPTFAVFAFAGLRLAPASTQIISNLSVLRTTRHSLHKLYLDCFSANKVNENIDLNYNKNEIINFKKIILKDISFKYSTNNLLIFKKINLEIHKGDTIGLIGESGAGKTTLLDILLGLLHPTYGDVLIDGQNIKNDILKLRSNVAYLPQKVFLTDDSIKKNIAFGVYEDKINIDKLKQAIEKSKSAKFINNLPDGYDTQIGERGIRLSGGQKQRIALARAFYSGKNILILDESTNSLDKETESQIITELKNLDDEITVIVISHNNNVMNFCNKVYKIEDKILKKIK